ncbi:MAG: thiamine-phosphate kinase [Candidatus Coatesbacteria bacterium]|nr:thiamine-phosphate kinase [Candidatus Coatesbacteria bacterium]
MRLSEKELISLIRRKLEANVTSAKVIVGPGDDAAVIAQSADKALVISTDALVEGVHFSLDWATAFLLGQKSLLSSISDIFAMGARPQACLVSLGLPAGIEPPFIEDLFDGMIRQANRFGACIVGGNISRSERLFVDMTVTGIVHPGAVITRAGAKVGDSIFVTGDLGGAALAVKCLLERRINGQTVARVESILRGDSEAPPTCSGDAGLVELLARFFVPRIRADESQLLAEARICTSMIDLSDGIGSDLGHICQESGVGALVEIESVPLFDMVPVAAMTDESDLTELAICGGEDYELLFTVDPGDEARLQELLGVGLRCPISKIGRIISKSEGLIYLSKNGECLDRFAGFDHFARRAEGREQ